MLSQINSRDPIAWLEFLASLDVAKADWRLAVIQHIDKLGLSLSPPRQVMLEKTHAAALLDGGEIQLAKRKYAELREKLPDDGEVFEGWARMFAMTSPPDWNASLQAWRDVLARSRPATPRWFRAKLAIATALNKLGKSQRAAELIDMLAILHPEMGGGKVKEQFVRLREQCQVATLSSDE